MDDVTFLDLINNRLAYWGNWEFIAMVVVPVLTGLFN